MIALCDHSAFFDSWLYDRSDDAERVMSLGAWGFAHGPCLAGSPAGPPLSRLYGRWALSVGGYTLERALPGHRLLKGPQRPPLVHTWMLLSDHGPSWTLPQTEERTPYEVFVDTGTPELVDELRARVERGPVPLTWLLQRVVTPVWNNECLERAVITVNPMQLREWYGGEIVFSVSGQRATMSPAALDLVLQERLPDFTSPT
ncbi:MAG: hypothetical protein ABMB14_40695 [Myxococcota bacterium]